MHVDYALVGGGLQNGLIALALLDREPAARIALIERGARVGGNHTWCYHGDDVPPEARHYIEPLARHTWSGYSVTYMDYSRELDERYAMIASEDFAEAIEAAFERAPAASLLTEAEAVRVEAQRVELTDGRVITAEVVIDARGPERHQIDPRSGFQKFVGLEVTLTAPHGLTRPILMDATVPQLGGFRFFYVLPFGPDRLLIEDTRFTDDAALVAATWEQEVLDYAAVQGWTVARIERREHGVLPLTWAPGVEPPEDGVLRGGYQGGFFHPVTGYSFPLAARLATVVGRTPRAELPAAFARLRADVARRHTFCFLLNRAFFVHCAPEDRWTLMSRFYRRPAGMIRRFYALQMSWWDRFIAVAGPIPRCLRWRPRPIVALEEKAA